MKVCPYGLGCYRKRPEHFHEFSHPKEHKIANRFRAQKEKDSKKSELENSTRNIDKANFSKNNDPDKSKRSEENKIALSEKFGLFFTEVNGIKSSIWSSLSFGDLLRLHPNLESSVHFNYMIDLEFVLKHHPNSSKILFVSGDTLFQPGRDGIPDNIFQSVVPVPQFGTHHTKMSILKFRNIGLRVAIYSANLLDYDWRERTQVIWLSPLLPLLKEKSKTSSEFETDLVEYIDSYSLAPLNSLLQSFEKYDFSSIKARFIGSSPGRRRDKEKWIFGHLKLRKVLKKISNCAKNDKLVAQCSSIGSLRSRDSWLYNEFLASLMTCSDAASYYTKDNDAFSLVYPTVEQIRCSKFGYSSGGSFPYSAKTHESQKWIINYMSKWEPDEKTGRSRVMPHSKIYQRVSDGKVKWFLSGSHNLSKAAWGQYEKGDTQLHIRSFEASVLLIPEDYGLESFNFPAFPNFHNFEKIQRYSDNDFPWLYDNKYLQPDDFNQTWDPK